MIKKAVMWTKGSNSKIFIKSLKTRHRLVNISRQPLMSIKENSSRIN